MMRRAFCKFLFISMLPALMAGCDRNATAVIVHNETGTPIGSLKLYAGGEEHEFGPLANRQSAMRVYHSIYDCVLLIKQDGKDVIYSSTEPAYRPGVPPDYRPTSLRITLKKSGGYDVEETPR
jgi:hypothetical protein